MDNHTFCSAMARLNVKESVSSNKVKVNWATVKFFGKKTYSEEEIDEIRKEWASFVLEKNLLLLFIAYICYW
ncbi:hypothetical protein CUMW_191530 [Citrus unshiu]|uniref:Uncharacterized protein n=1 Tax=Citrus unshiu TaxID=55188 RepID=A0A2H5Q318_CITUN|nr:hypothetical protein CUMW_191530 [Citrus unshiu]